MKIIHVFKDFYPPLAAGITRYVADVAEESVRRGHEVDVHVAGVKTSYREVLPNGVVVYRHREWARALSSPLAPALAVNVRRATASVLHVHMPNPLGELAALLNTKGAPIVASFHARLGRQHFLEPLWRPLREALLRRAGAVLVSSESMACAPELAPAAEKVIVLPYGVSPKLLPIGRSAESSNGRQQLLFVGRLVYYKGVDVLLRAVAHDGQCTLTVIGDGPLRGELERLASSLCLDRAVEFRGPVSDDQLRHAYATHDVLVLPSVSRAEAFGLAMAEAMASGMPVVSTELQTGTSWVNLDGVSGLVVSANDELALAGAFERLRAPGLRASLAAGARARADALFSFRNHCDQLFEVYERVTSDG